MVHLKNKPAVPPPTITPSVNRVTMGQRSTFTAVPSFSVQAYQWQFNDAHIINTGRHSGINTVNLTIDNITEVDEGNYTCIVTSSMGMVVSSQVAHLFVCK